MKRNLESKVRRLEANVGAANCFPTKNILVLRFCRSTRNS